jgi:leucyl-tRNA synthetase
MPQWAGSSWYYLGFALGKNLKIKDFNKGWNKKIIDYWVPVDLYVGGVEHATRHLIYARFWHKFLYDLGLVSSLEPFRKLINQGLILGPDNEKMSKSRGNVINPDEIIRQYGADTLRIYEMFLGPLEMVKPWDTKSIIGVFRFLNRVWNLVVVNLAKNSFSKTSDKDISKDLKITLHKTIKKVTEDVNNLKFNTAISALMEFENKLTINASKISKKDFKEFMNIYLVLLYPFAPHISSELYQILNPKKLIDNQVWPKFDVKLVKETQINYAIQVNGKLRATLTVSKSLSQKEIINKAQELEGVRKWLENKTILKTIFIKDKIINFVIKS